MKKLKELCILFTIICFAVESFSQRTDSENKLTKIQDSNKNAQDDLDEVTGKVKDFFKDTYKNLENTFAVSRSSNFDDAEQNIGNFFDRTFQELDFRFKDSSEDTDAKDKIEGFFKDAFEKFKDVLKSKEQKIPIVDAKDRIKDFFKEALNDLRQHAEDSNEDDVDLDGDEMSIFERAFGKIRTQFRESGTEESKSIRQIFKNALKRIVADLKENKTKIRDKVRELIIEDLYKKLKERIKSRHQSSRGKIRQRIREFVREIYGRLKGVRNPKGESNQAKKVCVGIFILNVCRISRKAASFKRNNFNN